MGALTLSLSSPEIADDLSRYVRKDADGVSTFEVAVKGARCANCIAKIEAGIGGIAGVTNARLNLSTGKLAVAWRGNAVSPKFVVQRVRALGYEAQPYDAGTSIDASAREGRCCCVTLPSRGLAPVS